MSRRSRPRLYGTILAALLIAGSGMTIDYVVKLVDSYLRFDGIIVAGPSLGSASMPLVIVIALSIAAAVMLLKDARARPSQLVTLAAMLAWTLVSIYFLFALLASI